MLVTFDANKDVANIAKHGLSLRRASDLEVEEIETDTRFVYGEPRFRAWGTIDGLPYCLGFTVRDGVLRAISLRRAHLKEYRQHAL